MVGARRLSALVLLVNAQKEASHASETKAQQMAAGAALSAKRGERKVSELKGASKSMYKSMSEQQLDEMASTKRKGKPQHKSKP
jgi:Zn/Cd-binding protein ZinT